MLGVLVTLSCSISSGIVLCTALNAQSVQQPGVIRAAWNGLYFACFRHGWDGDAILEVTLLNNEDGFKYERYGDSITIRRTIKQPSGGSFTLLAHTGKVCMLPHLRSSCVGHVNVVFVSDDSLDLSFLGVREKVFVHAVGSRSACRKLRQVSLIASWFDSVLVGPLDCFPQTPVVVDRIPVAALRHCCFCCLLQPVSSDRAELIRMLDIFNIQVSAMLWLSLLLL